MVDRIIQENCRDLLGQPADAAICRVNTRKCLEQNPANNRASYFELIDHSGNKLFVYGNIGDCLSHSKRIASLKSQQPRPLQKAKTSDFTYNLSEQIEHVPVGDTLIRVRTFQVDGPMNKATFLLLNYYDAGTSETILQFIRTNGGQLIQLEFNEPNSPNTPRFAVLGTNDMPKAHGFDPRYIFSDRGLIRTTERLSVPRTCSMETRMEIRKLRDVITKRLETSTFTVLVANNTDNNTNTKTDISIRHYYRQGSFRSDVVSDMVYIADIGADPDNFIITTEAEDFNYFASQDFNTASVSTQNDSLQTHAIYQGTLYEYSRDQGTRFMKLNIQYGAYNDLYFMLEAFKKLPLFGNSQHGHASK